MSSFSKIIRESLKNTNLKMIRVKNDPGQCNDDLNSIKDAQSYEGYILEEDGEGNIVAYVAGPDPMMDNILSLGPDEYETMAGVVDQDPETLHLFKKESVLYLLQKGLISKKDKDKIEEIMSCEEPRDVEIILRHYNITDSELLNLYRDLFKPSGCGCHE